MTKAVTVSKEAIDILVSDRAMQSVEFEQGNTLCHIINGTLKSAHLPGGLLFVEINNIGYLTTASVSASSKYLVMDLEGADPFKGLSKPNTLFAFQKLIRFAKKLWDNLSLNFSEQPIAGTSKAVIFPLPGYFPKPYRMVLERDPMPERLKKRDQKGNFLLLFKAGTDSGTPSEEASLTNFKRAYDGLAELKTDLVDKSAKRSPTQGANNPLFVSELATPIGKKSAPFRRYDDWLPLLTQQQKDFVGSGVSAAHRIEGAAGTGKTLSLILKSIFELRRAREAGSDFHAAFITHSDATKESLLEAFSVVDAGDFWKNDRSFDKQSLNITTLFEACTNLLSHAISESEFIDRDALESKETQLLYIEQALTEALEIDFPIQSRKMSDSFTKFVKTTENWDLTQMIQHEISVSIKGRASGEIDLYKKIPPLKYGLPTENVADKSFVFTVFRKYEKSLSEIGNFDNDDIILSTTGQLDTPIWRRRRLKEGYDALFIDETHLFNINELHLFHHLTRNEHDHPIVYSVDRSQAIGDKGWTNATISKSLELLPSSEKSEKFNTIFRSSPDIVALSFSVISSGASLFTNFDNPMEAASSAFTEDDERKVTQPTYIDYSGDDAMIEDAFGRAEAMQRALGCSRSEVLITTLDEEIFKALLKFVTDGRKPVTILKRRGDIASLKQASQQGHLVLGHADYVGGLEFQGVVVVAVDDGRVPPIASSTNDESRNFLSYSSHNRLYVAISRAKYRVELLGEKVRGPSRLLASALERELLARPNA